MRYPKSFCQLIPTLFLLSCSYILYAQTAPISGISLIEDFLKQEDFYKADSTVTAQVNYFKSNGDFDSLAKYPYYVGWVKHVKGNTALAIQASEEFVEYLKHSSDDKVLWKGYLEQALFYELIGYPKKAYEKNQKALSHVLKVPTATGEDIGKIESNLGIYAHRFGDLALSKFHLRKALQSYSSYPKTSAANIFNSNNNMGTVMWFSSKSDSAIFYYSQALEHLKMMEPTPHNKFYRNAMVLNNLSGLLDLQGKKTEAQQMMRDVIKNLDNYLDSEITNSAKNQAIEFRFQAIENLAGSYKALGNYTKTLELLKHSYVQKQKHFDKNNPQIFKSLVLLGQAELALKNYQTASLYLDKGIEIINLDATDNIFWNADAHSSKARIYEELGNIPEAEGYYMKSQMLYERAFQGEYDNIYLEFLTHLSLFYAKNGKKEIAKETAEKGYHYILKTQGDQTLSAFLQILNMAEVHYVLEDYKNSLKYSQQGISILNSASSTSDFFIDSVRIEFDKPYAILLKVKAAYQLESNRDQEFLETSLAQLDSAISILERHKSIFSSPENLTILLQNNREVFDFAKKIALELYFKTQQEKFLDKAMGLLESSLYNRIRSRLNANDAIQFTDVPKNVFDGEREIRSSMVEALNSGELGAYFLATAKWEEYLEEVKEKYPSYYKMRYATIEVPIGHIQAGIADGLTVVRYFFVEKDLYALVMANNKKEVHKLDYHSEEALIAKLNNHKASFNETASVIQQLYQQLWAPFADQVFEKAVIIPDGELYNLSFEILAPQKINSFKDLAQIGLLAKYAVSYNYSLLLLNVDNVLPTFDGPFAAFVPGFSEEIKQAYKNRVTDSIQMDRAFLKLLPQPFTSDLAQHLLDKFGGKGFFQERSTKKNFLKEGGRHKILHLGTHAASNNLNPELSRLFFAKDLNSMDSEEGNALHAYEIYNYDLSSNLTVLTACETGKPGYQPGEGMISLAHAFNYAGSQSLLTSLWEIDEQASTRITDYFYQYLAEGYAKDEALRQAKLDYLAKAEGRTIAPQYWAGLVIMGDTAPIYLEEKRTWKFWAVGGLLVLAFMVIVFYKRKFS